MNNISNEPLTIEQKEAIINGISTMILKNSEMFISKEKYDKLQEENERLKELCNKYEEEHSTTFEYWKRLVKEDYKSRNEKAIKEVIRIIEIILEQPSKDKSDDLWIINKLEGIQILLQGEDKEIDQLEK